MARSPFWGYIFHRLVPSVMVSSDRARAGLCGEAFSKVCLGNLTYGQRQSESIRKPRRILGNRPRAIITSKVD